MIRVDGFFRTNAILEFRMGFVRSTLAFPFYVLAFVFHLLTALFTVIAQKIAGEESGPPRRKKTVSHVIVAAFVIAAAPVLVSLNPPAMDVSRLAPQAAMDYRAVKAEFTPEQLAWIKPLIRLTACIFAENAIRHKLEPMPVSFSPCGGGAVHATLDDNLIDVVVSGIATAGAIERPFTVTLQHYPPSTNENGFIALSIQTDTDSIPMSDGAI
jgi:hypothetical protein